MDKEILILHEPTASEPFILVDKPSGLPSAPLFDGDDSVLTRVLSTYPSVASVSGKKAIEKGLVHRLDNDTSGLVLIASNQEFYDEIQKFQCEGMFRKWYRAGVNCIPDTASLLGGFPSDIPVFEKEKAVAESRFRPYGLHNSQVRPVTASSGRAAMKKCGETLYKTEISLSDIETAVCSITAGYRHQVRSHLAWCGFPVKNDPLYNPVCQSLSSDSNCSENFSEKLDFRAFKISFPGFEFEV